MLNIRSLLGLGKKAQEQASSVEKIKEQISKDIYDTLTKDPGAKNLVQEIVDRSNHAIKPFSIENYYKMHLMDSKGDLASGQSPSVVPRIQFKEDKLIQPVTLKFPRLMSQDKAIEKTKSLWEGVDKTGKFKKLIYLDLLSRLIAECQASIRRAERENFLDDEDKFYYLQDKFFIAQYQILMKAIAKNNYTYSYGVDGEFSVRLTGSCLAEFEQLKDLYMENALDKDEFEAINERPPRSVDEVIRILDSKITAL